MPGTGFYMVFVLNAQCYPGARDMFALEMKNLWLCRCNTHECIRVDCIACAMHTSSTSGRRTPEIRRPSRKKNEEKKLYFFGVKYFFPFKWRRYLAVTRAIRHLCLTLTLSTPLCVLTCSSSVHSTSSFVCHHVLWSKWKIIACFDHRLFLLNTPVRFFVRFALSVYSVFGCMLLACIIFSNAQYSKKTTQTAWPFVPTTLLLFDVCTISRIGAHCTHTHTHRHQHTSTPKRNWFPFFRLSSVRWQCLCSPHGSRRRLFSLPIFYLWRKIWSSFIWFEQPSALCAMCMHELRKMAKKRREKKKRLDRSTMPLPIDRCSMHMRVRVPSSIKLNTFRPANKHLHRSLFLCSSLLRRMFVHVHSVERTIKIWQNEIASSRVRCEKPINDIVYASLALEAHQFETD